MSFCIFDVTYLLHSTPPESFCTRFLAWSSGHCSQVQDIFLASTVCILFIKLHCIYKFARLSEWFVVRGLDLSVDFILIISTFLLFMPAKYRCAYRVWFHIGNVQFYLCFLFFLMVWMYRIRSIENGLHFSLSGTRATCRIRRRRFRRVCSHFLYVRKRCNFGGVIFGIVTLCNYGVRFDRHVWW